MRAVSNIEQRRRRVAELADLTDQIVLVDAGVPIPIPGTDQYHHSRAHPDFRYLADADIVGATLAHDSSTGEWELFAPQQSVDDRMWHGVLAPVGRPSDELEDWLQARTGRAIVRLGGARGPDGTHTGTTGSDAQGDHTRRVERAVHEARVVKDSDELDRMRRAAAATAVGFEEVYRCLLYTSPIPRDRTRTRMLSSA